MTESPLTELSVSELSVTELSLGELDSLVLKAYRGAGFSWGMAQEAGRAASWLAAQNLPAAAVFAKLLTQIDGVDSQSLTPQIKERQWVNHVVICPVVCGTVLSDLGSAFFNIKSGDELRLGSVFSPLILLPFVASCAVAAECSLQMTLDAQPIIVGNATEAGYSEDAIKKLQGEVVIIKSDVQNIVLPMVLRRATITEADKVFLEGLAHRTYVPASEQSRTGAGAGLTDND